MNTYLDSILYEVTPTLIPASTVTPMFNQLCIRTATNTPICFYALMRGSRSGINIHGHTIQVCVKRNS
jgi:hypothetical protein